MLKETRIRKSRDAWKNKARIRADQSRDFRKIRVRFEQKIIAQNERIKILEEALKKTHTP
jgi:uncharacterized protein (DUF427 family)